MAVIDFEAQSVNTGSDFEPCPEDDYQGVVVDVVDCGWEEKIFKGESKGWHPRIQYVYQVDHLREDGKRYLVFGRKLWVSSDERSSFYKETVQIMGEKAFKEAVAARRFDAEAQIGYNVDLQVVHNASADGTKFYANIGAMKPWNTKRGPLIEPKDYERRCWRDNWVQPDPSAYENRDSAESKLKVGMAKAPVAPPPPAARSAAEVVMDEPEKAFPANSGRVAVGSEHNPKQYAKDLAAGKEPAGFKAPVREPLPADYDGPDVFDGE